MERVRGAGEPFLTRAQRKKKEEGVNAGHPKLNSASICASSRGRALSSSTDVIRPVCAEGGSYSIPYRDAACPPAAARRGASAW